MDLSAHGRLLHISRKFKRNFGASIPLGGPPTGGKNLSFRFSKIFTEMTSIWDFPCEKHEFDRILA